MKNYIFILILILFFSCNEQTKYKFIADEKTDLFILTNNSDSIKITKNKKPKLFFALDPECPLCKSYSTKINDIYMIYQNMIDFYGFFPSPVFSSKKINNFIDKSELKMPVFIDTNQVLTYFLDAKVTPECFFLNNKLNVIYQGLIDDRVKALGRTSQNTQNNYLINAIESYLKDEQPKTNKTNAIGCIIERLP